MGANGIATSFLDKLGSSADRGGLARAGTDTGTGIGIDPLQGDGLASATEIHPACFCWLLRGRVEGSLD